MLIQKDRTAEQDSPPEKGEMTRSGKNGGGGGDAGARGDDGSRQTRCRWVDERDVVSGQSDDMACGGSKLVRLRWRVLMIGHGNRLWLPLPTDIDASLVRRLVLYVLGPGVNQAAGSAEGDRVTDVLYCSAREKSSCSKRLEIHSSGSTKWASISLTLAQVVALCISTCDLHTPVVYCMLDSCPHSHTVMGHQQKQGTLYTCRILHLRAAGRHEGADLSLGSVTVSRGDARRHRPSHLTRQWCSWCWTANYTAYPIFPSIHVHEARGPITSDTSLAIVV